MCGGLITSEKTVVKLTYQNNTITFTSRAFYEWKIFQPINAMKHNTKNPTTIDKVRAAEVDYVMKQLKANRYNLL